MIAGLATLALVGAATVASAQAGPAMDVDSGPDASASFKGDRWSKDGTTVSGRYVTFEYDNGTITDYARVTADGETTIFRSISIAEYDPALAKARAKGAVLAFKDGNLSRGVVFDARNAAFAIASPVGNTITLVVADGVHVTYHAGEEKWSPEGVLLQLGDRTARLVVNDAANVSVDGQTITIVLDEKGNLRFRIDGYPGEALKERWAMHKMRHHLDDGKGPRGLGADVREMARQHGRR